MRGGFNFFETHIITTHMKFCCEGRGRNIFFSEERVISRGVPTSFPGPFEEGRLNTRNGK